MQPGKTLTQSLAGLLLSIMLALAVFGAFPATPSSAATRSGASAGFATAAPSSPLVVPRLSQRDGRWADIPLGFNKPGDTLNRLPLTIGNFGCFITSFAMVFNFYQPGFTDPKLINEALKAKNGFVNGGELVWSKVNEVAPTGVRWLGFGNDWGRTDQELAAGRPVLAEVSGGKTSQHMVVITGKSGNAYTLNDSWDGQEYTWPKGGLAGTSGYRLTRFAYVQGPSQTPTVPKPAAPTNLRAAALSASAIRVDWQDNANNEQGVKVFRWSWDSRSWNPIATLGANATSYTDNGLQQNTTYYYIVAAFNAAGESRAANYVYAKTQPSSRPEIVVDDRSGGFTRGGRYWWESGIGYNGHAFWTYANGSSVDSWGEWRAELPGGRYEVFVFVPRDNATTRQARYDVFHQGGTARATVNQANYFDAWVPIGTFEFRAGNDRRVRLTDATGESSNPRRKVAFDAVRFVPR
ncbi:MAG: C39 family peptidase [Chloroflexi bacterium]|nr:C39 family peptidase [Chloroflexota bacterium]